MRSLFEAGAVEQIKERLARLQPDCQREWDTMTAAQAMAHCAGSTEWTAGTDSTADAAGADHGTGGEADGAWK